MAKPYLLTAEELQEIGFSEDARRLWWKGRRNIRYSPKPWDLWLYLGDNFESFAEVRQTEWKIQPGHFGPLPMPPDPYYRPGVILDFLAQNGQRILWARPDEPSHWHIPVTRNMAFALRTRFC